MATEQPNYQVKTDATWLQVLRIVVSLLAADISQSLSLLPRTAAFVVVYTAMLALEYWRKPRPPVPFSEWLIKLLLCAIFLSSFFWLIPMVLSRWIRPSVSYAVPIFAGVLLTYWIGPLYPTGHKPSFKSTLNLALLLAVVLGVLASSWWENLVGPSRWTNIR